MIKTEKLTQIGQTRRRSAWFAALASFILFWFCTFVALGTWQVHRLAWKRDLIARVDARVEAPPIAPPGPENWAPARVASSEYRHVRMRGAFLNDKVAYVQAVSDSGPGYWVFTPMETAGFTVFVNRGFVPPEDIKPGKQYYDRPNGPVTITGLLRLTEPKGGFLQSNDPRADQWHSRDVAAIATSRGLHGAAPYFVDADATPNPGGSPVGGLTVISFPNNHLSYAITWYGLALLSLVAGVVVARSEFGNRPRA